jgi:hypothetical protein
VTCGCRTWVRQRECYLAQRSNQQRAGMLPSVEARTNATSSGNVVLLFEVADSPNHKLVPFGMLVIYTPGETTTDALSLLLQINVRTM